MCAEGMRQEGGVAQRAEQERWKVSGVELKRSAAAGTLSLDIVLRVTEATEIYLEGGVGGVGEG